MGAPADSSRHAPHDGFGSIDGFSFAHERLDEDRWFDVRFSHAAFPAVVVGDVFPFAFFF